MNEIKFKVWDKMNKKWIDDSDMAINQAGLLFIRYEGQTNFHSISLTKSENYIIAFYTGLKDKNGKMIFEGDKVRVNGFEGEVYWHRDSWFVQFEEHSKRLGETKENYIKIIGYENLNLTK